MKSYRKYSWLVMVLSLTVVLAACSEKAEDAVAVKETPAVFLKAEPAVGAVLDRPPRTIRLFFTELPDVPTSSLKLFGEQGEISLSRFHTMGADDLMIEIDDHPLPNGTYRVEWMAMLGEEKNHYMGEYEFTVAVED